MTYRQHGQDARATVAVLGALFGLLATTFAFAADAPRVLHVSADGNNLPFSNEKLEGFENKIAQLIAHDLGATLEYHFRAQRRGFFREELSKGSADMIMGVPSEFDKALATKPYYRSSYVFVMRANSGIDVASFDDPMLRKLKIGIQLTGDANTPPAIALSRRNMVDNIVGYTVYGNYAEPNPPARIIEAVARGDVDVAVAWGPMAGYFAKRQATPLVVKPVNPQVDEPLVPMAFDMSIGVKKSNTALRDELNGVLDRRHSDVEKILDQYNIPRVTPLVKTASANKPLAHYNPDDNAKKEVPGCCD